VTERADVAIVGSGFGGSITAWRLAELYVAAGVDPSAIAVIERGRRYGHTDFRQSMDIDHLSDIYLLIQGQGAQVVTANAVGGGARPARRSSGATGVRTTVRLAGCGRTPSRGVCSIRTTLEPNVACG
jgi:choline dehydrogenase-like flavoprotein